MSISYLIYKNLNRYLIYVFVISAAIFLSFYWIFPNLRTWLMWQVGKLCLLLTIAGLIAIPFVKIAIKKRPTFPKEWKNSISDFEFWNKSKAILRFFFVISSLFELFGVVFSGLGFSVVLIFAIQKIL